MKSDTVGNAAAIRSDYAKRFPPFAQPLITRFTGKPAAGERAPRDVLHPIANTVATIIQWPLAVAASSALLMENTVLGIVLLPVFWLVGVNALRRLQVVVAHHAVHQEITGYRRINYWIQVVVSAESLVHNWEDYFNDHVRGHHSRKIFTTAADPDAQLLLNLGFTPGTSRKNLWRRLMWTIVSPRFHVIFLKARAMTNFVTAPWHRRSVAILWIGVLAYVGWLLPFPVFLATVLVPMFPLYHVSALLQFTSEHAWLASENPVTSAEEYSSRCWGRFFLEPLPARRLAPAARIRGWIVWSSKIAFVHLPLRAGVIVGDLPAHDHHHLHPADHEWTKALWQRQSAIDNGDDRGMADREFCNLHDVIDEVFLRMLLTPARLPDGYRAQVSQLG